MTVTNIIPAETFEVRKLTNFRVQLDATSCCLFSGWAIYDHTRKGFVASEKQTTDGRTVLGPWLLRTKRTALLACSEGLIEGYDIVAA